MKGIGKLATVIAKVLEIFHYVGAALLTCAAVCSVFAPAWVGYFVSFDAKECCAANLEVYGFEIAAPVINGIIDKASFLLFCIGGVIILSVMALVFRSLYLIFKSSESAPFHKDNIRLLNRIGFYSVFVPVIGIVMSVIVRLVNGVESSEISVDMSGIFMGIIVFCLSRFFVYGTKLEEDVDGLV